MRAWEAPLFFGFALALHLAAFGIAFESGQHAAPGGAAGDATITVTAASPQVVALVEAWEAPPEVAATPEPPAALTWPATPVPAPSPEAPQPATESPPLLSKPEAHMPDTLPRRLEAPPPPEAASLSEPEPGPAVAVSERPAPRPERLVGAPAPSPAEPKPTSEPRPAPQPSVARAEQRASGSPGPATRGGTGEAPVATAAPGERADLAQLWGAQIQERLQRALVYPPQARTRRLEGRAMLELTVGADGRIVARRLLGSSGSPILDQAAIETVDRARGIPPAPQGLSGGSFTFSLPVAFQSP